MQKTWVWSLDWEASLKKGYGNPLQYFCLENPHGQRSLVGYSPWGCKVSDTTELIRTVQHMCKYILLQILFPYKLFQNNSFLCYTIGPHWLSILQMSSVQFISVTQSYPILCDPMDCSTHTGSVHMLMSDF